MLMIIAASLVVPPIVQNTIESYTATAPMTIVKGEMPEADMDHLDEQVERFTDAIEDGKTPEPLILSGDDLNALLQKLWQDEGIPGEMALDIEDGRLRSHISIPLEPGFSIGPFTPDVSGRYLNGTVTFRLSLTENNLNVKIERFIVNGKELPGWIVGAIEREIIDPEILQNEELREFTDKLDRVDINTNSIVLNAATQ